MKYALLTWAALTTLALSACENRTTDLPPGKYERTSSSTDSSGTTTERESTTDVSVDKYGHKKAVVKSKTTKDPKGLMNKTTTQKSEEVVDEK